ncbi:MAG: hypothetical protein II961_07885 [Candidatus Riflebacteria bacterium]|nr:hypothetical protein [Candidatus Riflebacteria bacterium]
MKNINLFKVIVLFGLMFTGTVLFADNEVFVTKEEADLVKKITDVSRDDNSIPSFMKGFTAEYISRKVKIGRSENDTDEKLLEVAKNNKPQNYIDYAKVFCPQIMKETKKPKNVTISSFEELAKKPPIPNFKTLRSTVFWWSQYVRLLLEEDKNDNAALVVTYAGYYVARDLEESYSGSRNMICKSIAIALSGISSNELLRWVEKPRVKSAKIAKYLAKDLLELVKKDYPFSSCMDFEKAAVYSTLYESGKKDEKTKAFVDIMLESDYLKEMITLFYVEPKTFIDKPFYMCKAELDKYSKKVEDANEKIMKEMEDFQNNVNGDIDRTKIDIEAIKRITINQILSMAAPNFAHIKGKYEEKLAKMEMVAISLAYNAFYCENQKEPSSVEELEKWFGEKLPLNRFTGKPYSFNTENGYVLYNYGSDNKKDEKNGYDNNDISFKFSAK